MSGLFERALEKLGDGDESHERRKSPALPGAAADAAQESQAEQPIVDADVVGRAAGQPSPQPPATTDSISSEPPVTAERRSVPPPIAMPSGEQQALPPPRKPAGAPPAVKRPDEPVARTSNYKEIDLAALTAAGMITPQSSDTALSEQHRMIKRPLLLKAFPHEGKRLGNENVILVTSSVPGEGKTFLSVNLAMSIAMEVDRTVLLVDGDSAKSNISKLFGITADRGLTDYLASDELDLADVLIRTNIDNLTILPAGGHVANVTELLSSEQMKRLTEELASRYSDRVIIIDSPPLLAASGARVLAGLAGQIVFVVEAIRTTQNAMREALRMIETHANIGLVLNKSRERPRAAYQYGYYGAGKD